MSFNPRTHTGCDGWSLPEDSPYQFVSIHAPTRGATKIFPKLKHQLGFQSTHPHGVRLMPKITFDPVTGFNPRTHTGCDDCFDTSNLVDTRFQSTHPHGVRRYRIGGKCNNRKIVSIHAPTRGATSEVSFLCIANRKVSIHAPTRGATVQI